MGDPGAASVCKCGTALTGGLNVVERGIDLVRAEVGFVFEVSRQVVYHDLPAAEAPRPSYGERIGDFGRCP